MLNLTATQAAIVALDNKTAKWAFYIYDKNGVGYSFGTSALDQTILWATGITWDAGISWSTGNLVSSGIMLRNFSGIGLQRNLAENTVIAPSEVTFDISNSGNVLDFLDFKGGNVLIELWLNDGISDIKVGGWRFRIKTAQPGYQNLKITAQDFLQDYLQGDYPNTRLPEDIFPSNRTYSNKALCIPVPFGTAYVPLRDVFITSAGYIMLGSPAYTYAITKIRSPRDRGAKCEWSSASYSFNQSTVADVNGAYWRVFQAIIADANNDGVAESPGSWLVPGGPVEDPPVQFTRSDTATMTNPADVINFVLLDMGIPAAMIDEAGTFAAAHTIFDGWGLTFNGAFWYKQTRQTVLANLLNQCHACLQVGEKIELKVLVKASQKTITGAEVLRTSEQGEGSFSYQDIVNNDLSDSGYTAYQKAGESQDEFVKVLAATNVVSSVISADVLECPFVQDSQNVIRIGHLHLQRKLLKEATAGFLAKGTCLALQPDDRITLNDNNYGGNYVVLIDSVQINKDLSIQFQCSKYSTGFDDWADTSPTALTIPTDTVTPSSSWQPVISGPDGVPTTGGLSNSLKGRLKVGETSSYVLIDPVTPLRISVFASDVEKMRMGNLNGFLGYATNLYGLAIGETTKYLKYDATNGLRIAGAITGSTIDIGGADATSFHVDIDGNLWAGAAAFNIATNPFAVSSAGILHATGAVIDGTITAVTGTIGGWTLTATMLKSGATGAARIELDQSAARISVKDATNASKVVMGYLNALAKHDGTGNWGVGDYGFWAAAGDQLKIDGDVRYKSGDWIVENDGSYLVQNAAAQTIIRLGTVSGVKGLFVYDATTPTQNLLAKFATDGIYLGTAGASDNYLSYTVAGGLVIKGAITIVSGSVPNASVTGLGALALKATADFASDVSGATKPANNATVGATWGSNITSQPSNLSGINSTEGTKLSGIAAGAQVNPANLAALDSTAATKLGGIATGADVTLAAVNGLLTITGGGIVINAGGVIRGGQTAYNTGAGFFFGYSTDAYKFSIGNPAGDFLTWDGTHLVIQGSATFVGSTLPWSDISDDGGRPADNATIGATWGTDISSQPTTLGGINATEGTKLSGIADGAQVNPANLAALDSTAATKLGGIAAGADVTDYTDTRVANAFIEVGARNLFSVAVSGSGGPIGGNETVTLDAGPDTFGTNKAMLFTANSDPQRHRFSTSMVLNQQYTFSCWLKSADDSSQSFSWTFTDSGTFCSGTATGVWTKFTGIASVENLPYAGNFIEFNWIHPNVNVWISHIKLESGNKVTDWSPAPEDVDSGIASAGTTAVWAGVSGQPTTLGGINATEGTKLSGIADGADVTSAHTAAAIAGQGALATKASVDLSTAEVTNKSLANLDSTANTKLGGIAAGATVGATWGTDLNSIPATLGAPSGSGLFLSATYMGFYASAAWKTYIDNAGNLVLGDIAGGNTGLSWNQATGVLTIKGAITMVSGSVPNASVTGLGALALKASVNLNSAEVTNKSLANLDTTANNKLAGIQAGADVTSSHTAAAIVSQGALATKNTADFAADVSGAQKPANNADVTLSAINGGLSITGGGITLSAGGAIKGGQTDYATGTGFFLGYSGAAYKFSIGSSTNYLTWDGSALTIKGVITATSGSFTGTVTATAGTIGGFTLSASALYAGSGATRIQLDTSAGVFLGATTFAAAPFKVSLAGVLTAAGAVITGDYKTSLTVGTTKGIWLNPSTNEMYFYGDRGDGTIVKLGTIGVQGATGGFAVGEFGTNDCVQMAVFGLSNTGVAVQGISNYNYGGYFSSVYVNNNCSALSFTDRTPHYEGDALAEIKKIKGKDGQIDHSTLPTFAQRKTTVQKKITDEKGKVILDGNGREKHTDEPADGRDIGAMVSILTVGMQQLLTRVETLEKLN